MDAYMHTPFFGGVLFPLLLHRNHLSFIRWCLLRQRYAQKNASNCSQSRNLLSTFKDVLAFGDGGGHLKI